MEQMQKYKINKLALNEAYIQENFEIERHLGAFDIKTIDAPIHNTCPVIQQRMTAHTDVYTWRSCSSSSYTYILTTATSFSWMIEASLLFPCRPMSGMKGAIFTALLSLKNKK